MAPATDSESLIALAARDIGRRDAELLLAAALNLSRGALLARGSEAVPDDVAARFTSWCARRATGEPVAYLLGRREFWSMMFEVSPAVLVPRPETELLVERVLEKLDESPAAVADLGTGSGAIAITLAHERPDWQIVGTDLSDDALTVARRNGTRLGANGVEWRAGDWYQALDSRRFDALVSNPPYIEENDPVLAGDGLRHEPRGALTPGGDGFAALVTLINGAPEHLRPGGWLFLEHGATQGATLRGALVARGFTHVTSHRDLAGHERVTEGQWSR